MVLSLKPSPKRQISDCQNLKSLQTTISKFDENGGKIPGRVEHVVQKEEITRYEQVLRFPQSFQKTCAVDT